MSATEEDDEQFYRDTERIAFPARSDEQLATLDSLGTRRKVRHVELPVAAHRGTEKHPDPL